MPERKPIRTDADVRNAKPEGGLYRRPVGAGLYLEVRPATEAHPGGLKLWRYRYRLPDASGVRKENMYALGEYGKGGKAHNEFTLAEAIEERGRVRELVKQGKHPVQVRRESKQAAITEGHNTFRAVALRWLETKRHSKSANYIQQIERALKETVFPAIGDHPITSITSAHLSVIVDERSKTAPTVALLIQQWCGAIFRYAIRKQLGITSDPAYILRGTVDRPPVRSKRPLLKHEFPAFMAAVQRSKSGRTTKIALLLLLYCFPRPGELCGASWSEFDLDGAIWRIPAERTKRNREHWVPLSSDALALLRELHTLTGHQKWLFPNARDPQRPMTTTALNRALERMGYLGRFSAHGFRATASTALNDKGLRHDVIEAQLAHAERNKTRASYNFALYWSARVDLMQTWAQIVNEWAAGQERASNVIPMREAIPA